MFVGDGINDSPVLAQSDVGCAINAASDITVGAAGIVLIKNDLRDVLSAILISQKSFQRIKINFVWAFLYNIILIPIAMGIFYPLGLKMDAMYAAVAMAMSSISVVSSSLYLKTYNPNKIIDNLETAVQQSKLKKERNRRTQALSKVGSDTTTDSTGINQVAALNKVSHSRTGSTESLSQVPMLGSAG